MCLPGRATMRLAMMEAREVVTSMEVAGPLEEEAGKETKVELGARAMLAIVEVVGPLGAVAGHLEVVGPLGAVAGHLETRAMAEVELMMASMALARAMLAIVEVVGPLGAVAGHLKTRAMAKVELLGAMASKKRRQTMEIALQLLDLLGAQLDTTHATGSTLRRLMGDSSISCGPTISCKSPR